MTAIATYTLTIEHAEHGFAAWIEQPDKVGEEGYGDNAAAAAIEACANYISDSDVKEQ